MRCPECGYEETKVVDTRSAADNIKRRRACPKCGFRFTTFETAEKPLLMVKKKGGSFETFDKQKLIKGIYNAIKKRPVSAEVVRKIADNIESYCANNLISVISTSEIGEMTLDQLRGIDDVAYIRFASVYKDFEDIESFIQEISSMNDKKKICTNNERDNAEKQ